MSYRAVSILLAVLLGNSMARADTLYKCTDNTGVVLYTNQKSTGKKCTVVSTDQPISTFGAPKQTAPAARNPSPGDFPRVDGEIQRGRDGDRRKILEQELTGEQNNLEKSRKALAEAEASRMGDEKSYQRYLDRAPGLKESVAVHERNIEALRRELANLK